MADDIFAVKRSTSCRTPLSAEAFRCWLACRDA